MARHDAARVRAIIKWVHQLVAELLKESGTLLAEFAATANAEGVAHLLDLASTSRRCTGRWLFRHREGQHGAPRGCLARLARCREARIARGAPIDARDTKGRTPLALPCVACVDSFWTHRRSPGSVEALLRAGASIAGVPFPSVVAVSGDVDNVILIPRRGSTVSGVVITRDGAPPPFASGVRFNLIAPEDNVLPTVRAPAVNNDWSFRLENLGGEFLFRVMGLPDDWMLDAVRLNDQDVVDVPYDVPTGGREITGLQVVLTKEVGTLAGDVVNADRKPARDATVVVFSEDADHWMPGSRWVRTTRPTSDGRFSIAGLPAGTYLAIARPFIIDGQWEDKEFLEDVRSDAAKVIVTPGAPAKVTLKLPVVP